MTNIERSPIDIGQWSASGASGALVRVEVESTLNRADRSLGAIIFGGTHGSLSVARSLGRQGIPVWLIETSRGVAGFSRYVQKRVEWNGPDGEGAVDWLIELADRHGLGRWVLFPAADPETRFVAENHARLSARFRVNTMPWSVLETAQDKSLLYKRAAEIGLAYPKSYFPDPVTGARPAPERFPVVIKPAMREDNNPLTVAKAWRADDQEDFERLYGEARKYLPADDIVVQEMIPGGGEVQFSYAALWHRGRPVASMVTRRTRQYAVAFGTGTFVETIDKPEIEEVGVRLLKSLDYHGLVEIEFKLDTRDGQYKVLDANTRTWAWIGLGEPAGIDFPWLAWRMETGDVPELKRGRAGASWRHLPRDILAGLHEVKTGRMTVGALVESLLRKSTGAVLAFDDPVPGIIDVPLVIPRLWSRLIKRLSALKFIRVQAS